MNQTSKIVITIVLTALVIGGGILFWQQNSLKELREEMQNLQNTNTEDQALEEQSLNEEQSNINAEDQTESENDSEPIGDKTSLPAGVEWLTYNDSDISFTYPKTFLDTPLQEDLDRNWICEDSNDEYCEDRTEWKIQRENDIIYIRPNFESPTAEFGSTYEIKILKDTWAAEEEWSTAAELHQGPESQWGEIITTKVTNYYVGVLRNLDLGFGQITNVYALVPGGVDGLGKSLKPTEKHFVIYAEPNVYSTYIEEILIPSIQSK